MADFWNPAGREVHLTTTDPAAHLTETLHGTVDGLQVSRIDPVAAVQAYRDHVMATKGQDLDDAGRAVLAEDLLSPCTEEIAVFQQFSRVLSESRHRFVVVNTAPTGHTLLLLDATGSYHREVARHMGNSTNFTTPLMRLQDPAQTKVILVTLAETTRSWKPRTCRKTWNARASIPGPGSSTTPSPPPAPRRPSCGCAPPARPGRSSG